MNDDTNNPTLLPGAQRLSDSPVPQGAGVSFFCPECRSRIRVMRFPVVTTDAMRLISKPNPWVMGCDCHAVWYMKPPIEAVSNLPPQTESQHKPTAACDWKPAPQSLPTNTSGEVLP